MTRIASATQQQVLLQHALRNQHRLAIAQEQISSGKKAHRYDELVPDVQQALSVREARSQTDGYRDTVVRLGGTLTAYDFQLGAIADATRELKQSALEVVGHEEGTGFPQKLEQAFSMVVSALNARVGNTHIFGGSRTDQAPVTVSSLADLQALPSAADAFANDQNKRRAVIAEGTELEFGVLADEVGLQVMEAFRRIADFQTGPNGPIQGPLTAAQRTFLETELTMIEAAVQTVQAAQVKNGLNAKRLEVLDDQHAQAQVFLARLSADVEDVNLAEAISRLNQEQAALEASFQSLATLSRLSLLNFL